MPDTLLVLTKTGIFFLGSDKKAQFFSPLESKENLNPAVPPFATLTRNKADKDKENFNKLLDILLEAGTKCGHFAKDKPDSAFAKAWDAALKDKNQVFLAYFEKTTRRRKTSDLMISSSKLSKSFKK